MSHPYHLYFSMMFQHEVYILSTMFQHKSLYLLSMIFQHFAYNISLIMFCICAIPQYIKFVRLGHRKFFDTMLLTLEFYFQLL